MPEYNNTNRGALFKNESDNENAPHYKGNINIEGDEFWLSAWIKTSKAGNKFMSLSVKPKEVKGKLQTPEQKHEEFNDEINFF